MSTRSSQTSLMFPGSATLALSGQKPHDLSHSRARMHFGQKTRSHRSLAAATSHQASSRSFVETQTGEGEVVIVVADVGAVPDEVLGRSASEDVEATTRVDDVVDDVVVVGGRQNPQVLSQ
mmetsp:Transcript_7567/g.21495  ORF Transcript_7567/g.21495 Transcript_7567/m.21495 type:complete len:121 (+) Transcript_7567:376-738(+)